MNITDKIKSIAPGVTGDSAGVMVEDLVSQALLRRRAHERRWYDNQFFDDGYHFRIISRKTGRVIDTVNRTSGYVERSIPRASRQIRGIANLLQQPEPYPVVYPERIIEAQFVDVRTGKFNQQAYQQAVDKAKIVARKQGIWLSTEWEERQDGVNKTTQALIRTMLNSVSFLQVYSDTRGKTPRIKTRVRDAFEVVLYGDIDNISDAPFVCITSPMDLVEIKTSPIFDERKAQLVTADDRYATSEIKDAYMRARFGTKNNSDTTSSAIVKELYIKEYLNDDNWQRAVKMSQDTGAMDGKSKGDLIMRHIFSANSTTLADEYIDYDDYPLAPLQMEPGPLYQVPFIERFIPQNKSLDIIVTRLEKWVNSMVVGVYQQRKGENFQVSNIPGGQILEYEQTPLAQMQNASVGNTPFQVVELIDKYIDEQGASTSVLGNVPTGVKANSAIENLQQQEYSNLKIPTLMLKKFLKNTAELMLERAHKDFLEPVEVSHAQDGQPKYFDVVGQARLNLPDEVNKDLPSNVVPLKKDLKLRIEIEPGLGLTMDGKKQAMQSIIDYMIKLNSENAGVSIAPEALMQVVKKFLETFGYGSTEEFMESVENGVTAGNMSENQIKQMQIAILQTLKDAKVVGPGSLQDKSQKEQSDQEMELLKRALDEKLDKLDDQTKIYDKASPEIRRQIEKNLGLNPASDEPISPQQADTADKIHGMVNANKQNDFQAQQIEQDQQAQAAAQNMQQQQIAGGEQ